MVASSSSHYVCTMVFVVPGRFVLHIPRSSLCADVGCCSLLPACRDPHPSAMVLPAFSTPGSYSTCPVHYAVWWFMPQFHSLVLHFPWTHFRVSLPNFLQALVALLLSVLFVLTARVCLLLLGSSAQRFSQTTLALTSHPNLL